MRHGTASDNALHSRFAGFALPLKVCRIQYAAKERLSKAQDSRSRTGRDGQKHAQFVEIREHRRTSENGWAPLSF